MNDPFATYAAGLSSPAVHAMTITPSDDEDLPVPTRAIYVGAPGDVAVVMMGGETVTFPGAVAGTTLPIRVRRVLATGTTSGALVGLY